MNKKKSSVLKIEKLSKENPSKLIVAEESFYGKKAGRKPIPIEERGTEIITIKITKQQKKYIEEQAGLIKIATFLKAKLTECGVLKDFTKT